MKKILFVLLAACSIGNISAQNEKIKGNKIVTVERRTVGGFHTIELSENFKVTLQNSTENLVRVETDSNIQDVIDVKVTDSVLKIRSNKKIKKSKTLNITISYVQPIQKMILQDKVEIKSAALLETPKLHIETNGDVEAFLSVKCEELFLIAGGKSHPEIHANATKVTYQMNDGSELKGITNAEECKIELYKKASAKLEGEINTLAVRAENDTDFYGEKLSSQKTSLSVEGSSDCYILSTEEITIDANNKAEIYLLGSPKVIMNTFADQAIIYKKDLNYSPGLF